MHHRKTAKVVLFSVIVISILVMNGWVFWQQALQYAMPTPVPANFVDVKIGEKVDLANVLAIKSGKPLFLHFFNFDCPCSRFNMRDFEALAHKYKNQIDFFVIIQSDDEDDVDRFNKKYDLDVPARVDRGGVISDQCGIYATPQAVILDNSSSIYFKGNYNLARYCTKKETRFAEIALDHLLKNEPLPLSVLYAVTDPYGCSLPSDETPSGTKNFYPLF